MLTGWNQEDIKIEISLSDTEVLEISTDDSINERLFINNINNSASENESASPFGICGSNYFNLEIADLDDLLSPNNINSPYYNKIKNGTKVKVYLEDTETGGYVNYGTVYINDIQGQFSMGSPDVITLYCKDKMDNIGSQENPKIPCDKDILVKDFIGKVVTGIEPPVTLDIDESIGNASLRYGITVGNKIRDTLNSLAQYKQARITVNRDNIMTVRSAFGSYGKEYVLSIDDVDNLSNSYINSTDYSKLAVEYNVEGFFIEDVLFNDNTHTLEVTDGNGKIIDDITFMNKALSIHCIKIDFDNYKYKSTVNILDYKGYQDGLTELKYELTGENVGECNIYIEGACIDRGTRTDERSLMDSDESGTAISLSIKYIITKEEAGDILDALERLVKLMSRQVVIKTSASPHIDIGDTIVLEDEDFTPSYRGRYRVISYRTVHGINYSNTLTLVKIGEVQ